VGLDPFDRYGQKNAPKNILNYCFTYLKRVWYTNYIKPTTGKKQ